MPGEPVHLRDAVLERHHPEADWSSLKAELGIGVAKGSAIDHRLDQLAIGLQVRPGCWGEGKMGHGTPVDVSDRLLLAQSIHNVFENTRLGSKFFLTCNA